MMMPEFRTARVAARPIAMSDGYAVFNAYAQDAEVTRYLTWRPHRDRAETDAYIALCLAAPEDVARTYVLTNPTDGAVLGALDLRRPAPHRVEFGYVLARRWWGMGLMTEVLTEVTRLALSLDGVFRIGAVCDVENIGSARVMEKSGLVREGMLRRWMVHPNIRDEPRDCFLYGMTR